MNYSWDFAKVLLGLAYTIELSVEDLPEDPIASFFSFLGRSQLAQPPAHVISDTMFLAGRLLQQEEELRRELRSHMRRNTG